MRCLWICLFWFTYAACAAAPDSKTPDTHILTIDNPRRALDDAETMLAKLPPNNPELLPWEALAAEAASLLVLPDKAKSHAQAGLDALARLNLLQPELQQRFLIVLAQSKDIAGHPKDGIADLSGVIATLEAKKLAPWLLVEALSSRGSMYGYVENYRLALIDLLRAYALADPKGERGRRGYVAAELGNIYKSMSDFSQAEQYYREAIADAEQSHSLVRLSIAQYSLADVLMNIKKYDESERLFLASRENSEKVGDAQGVAYANFGLGEVAVFRANYSVAEKFFQLALPALVAANDIGPQSTIAIGKSKIALFRKQYESAILEAQKALKIALEGEQKERHVAAYDALSDVYLAMSDFHKAYENKVLAKQLKEQILAAAHDQAVTEMGIRFEISKQKQENELLEKKNRFAAQQLMEEKHRTYFYSIGLVFLLLLVAFLVLAGIKNRQLRDHLSKIAHTDVLTNIASRRRILEQLEAEFGRARRYHFPLSIVVIDLDHFKLINDDFGHDAGDAVLKKFCEMVSGFLRDTDCFGRIGGEEFLLIFPHTNADDAKLVSDRLRESMATTDFGQLKGSRQPSFSAGVSMQTDDDQDERSLIKRADEAVYLAKNKGRNRVEIL